MFVSPVMKAMRDAHRAEIVTAGISARHGSAQALARGGNLA
jgi:hypothetical protein